MQGYDIQGVFAQIIYKGRLKIKIVLVSEVSTSQTDQSGNWIRTLHELQAIIVTQPGE